MRMHVIIVQRIGYCPKIVRELTSNCHGLCQTEGDLLPVCIVKLCHPVRVPVYLGQEHALAGRTW